MPKHRYKARNLKLTEAFLQERASFSLKAGYQKQKWVTFCEVFLQKGFNLWLYEARKTFSKYITIRHPKLQGVQYLVRFSNHPPIKYREKNGDCNFFVGKTHLATTTTDEAILAALLFFREQWKKQMEPSERIELP